VNQAGAAIMNDRNLWKQLQQQDNILDGKMAVMGSAFKLQYNMTAPKDNNDQDMVKLIDKFQTDYDQHKCDLDGESSLQQEMPAVVSFDKIQVSPEWWIKQMKVPTYSSDEQQNPIFSEHGYW
jgi:hypothetical protein